MTHLAAGLILGGIAAAVILIGAAFWAITSWLLGPLPATIALGVVLLLIIGGVIIDWITEKR
jgi:hypothetical protein